MKILLVEDDPYAASALAVALTGHYYTIDAVDTAKAAWAQIESYAYDLIVLDVMLPDGNGIGLCGKLRAAGYKLPILLLTAKNSTSDRVRGLEAGADDYVVKPYELQELIARIRALLRRSQANPDLSRSEIFTWEQLHLDLRSGTASYDDKPLRLTQKEYGLLEVLLRHPKQLFSRSALLDLVWTAGEFPGEESVTTHIKGLRQKLKSVGMAQDPIETVYGLGYRLRDLSEGTPAALETESLEIESLESKAAEPIAAVPSVSAAEAKVQTAIAQIRQKVLASLPEQIDLFDRVATALTNENLDPDLRDRAYLQAHRLIGSLGSLGFPTGSAIARQIEQLLKSDAPLAPLDAVPLKQLIADLQTSTGDSPAIAVSPSVPNFQPHMPKAPLLLIVDDDDVVVQDIQEEAETVGMRVQTAYDLTTARVKIAQEPPDVILLDLVFPEPTETGLTFLNELAQRELKIPTVMMTSSSGLSDRVMAARGGGCAFIEKPALAEEILNTIAQVLHQHHRDRRKVMVVDDDPNILQLMQTFLERWGLEVTTLQDPHQFWQVLEATSPDLLILDLIMPDYSGIDLCQAVRTASLWHDLPIVFLSAHCDRATIRQLFAAGADDYLSKPIGEEDLHTRILSRLERSRLSRHTADFDGLTGVYTHRRGIQNLTQLLRLATRNHQTLCLAILDLDLFKQVNDRYGHSMGDTVLKQFGSLLQQHFRSEDVTMRWGGEEFVVGLYGADRQQSVERLTKLLETWRQQKFLTDGAEIFYVTFSAGVAEYPSDGNNLETLYRNMDAALYRAKAAGRNRIVAVREVERI
ncbi:response regulator [Tumidithrix helvetica PCC 7403]|uniref:response regulator n=1 Tax=Tumidithrix helvetica TaxID=3457545 RepID=UPI003CB0CDB0